MTLNTVDNFNVMVTIYVSRHRKGSLKIGYYNFMGPPLNMWSIETSSCGT